MPSKLAKLHAAEWRVEERIKRCGRRSREPPINRCFLRLFSAPRKNAPVNGCVCVAQRRGFEPPVRFRRTHDFQSCSLNHSDISAFKLIYITVFFRKRQAFLSRFIKNLQKNYFYHKSGPFRRSAFSFSRSSCSNRMPRRSARNPCPSNVCKQIEGINLLR